jgi:DNA-binding transcriptional regulator YdaS (Cro superfamily)
MARLLGFKRPSRVTNWKTRGVPSEFCPEIERLTNFEVTCEQLNNKVDWSVLRRSSSPKVNKDKK